MNLNCSKDKFLKEAESVMKITKEIKDNTVILNISGYMTAHNIRPAKQMFEACLAIKPKLLVLNLENVEMIDSSGIGAIAFIVKRLRPGGDVKIVGAQGHVAKILRLVRFDKAVDLYHSINNINSYKNCQTSGTAGFSPASFLMAVFALFPQATS